MPRKDSLQFKILLSYSFRLLQPINLHEINYKNTKQNTCRLSSVLFVVHAYF